MAAEAKKNIVIIGGSFGGVSAAHYLLRHTIPKLPEKSTYQVVLVSKSKQIIDRPACPRALISDDLLPQDKLFIDIAKVFEQYPSEHFRFVQGTATQFNHTDRKVTINLHAGGEESIEFYAAVIATGASTRSPMLTMTRDSEYIRANWKTFREALPEAKTIVIAGGGPAGIETAGELGEYLNGRAGIFSSKLANPKVNITVVTADSKILPILRPAIAKKAEDLLAKVGVTVIKNSRVTSVSPEDSGTDTALATKTTVTLEDGKTLEADLYIPAMGARPNTSFVDQSLLSEDGRVRTSSTTFRVEGAGERIYAVGDAASAARPAIHNIFNGIPVLGANMKRDLMLAAGIEEAKVPKEKEFKEDTRESQLVPIGTSKGAGAIMGYQLPSWLIWFVKGRDYWMWTLGNLWNGKQWAKEAK